MERINERLKKLYLSYLPELKEMYKDLDTKAQIDININNYAGPLLISCWEEQYLQSKHKLMIFGQEPYGWLDDYMYTADDVDNWMKHYQDFRLGEDYGKVFWKWAHIINRMINGEDNYNFVWSNVNKFCSGDGPGRPCKEVLENEKKHFNVSSEEIRILQPEICIFLSGPKYDVDLKKDFVDLQTEQFGDYPINEVARLISKDLPQNSYRLYHPRYGNIYPDWYSILISKIVSAINDKK